MKTTKLTNIVTLSGVLLVFTPLIIPDLSGNISMMGGFILILSGVTIGSLIRYRHGSTGFNYNETQTQGITSRKMSAYFLGSALTLFYILLYWFPSFLDPLIRSSDGISMYMREKPSDQWFLYGTFYTAAVVIMGVRALIKYRSSKYQLYRTLSVMGFQFLLAWLIPAFLVAANKPEFYFSYFWPLKYEYLFPGTMHYLFSEPGVLGIFMFFWAALATFILTPILTYYFGKRWYCSWVCGCGGLAETAGDPFRHLSSSTTKSHKLERLIIYPVLIFVIVTTVAVWVNSVSGGTILGTFSQGASRSYGFLIGAMFSGVIGVGFYPLLGTRVWCRFGCPMAAILGIQQKFFSRFRISTNGAQCISCGNCSTYCEMGIDVKSYAQKGVNIVRASCVGCGVCSDVCPRGVLKLENSSAKRYNQGISVTTSGWNIK